MNATLEALADKVPTEHCEPDSEPDPTACKCGAIMSWRWYDFKGKRDPRWLAPPHDKCDDCREKATLSAARVAYRERQDAAGIPFRYQGFGFDRKLADKEGSVDFKRGCRESGTVGVTPGNVNAFRFVRDWKPGCGSAWLWGEKGGGKSHLVSMLGNKLLRPGGESREVFVDGVQYLAVNLPKRVIFTSDELLESAASQAISDSKANREDPAPDPVRRLIDADVVLYDDIGTQDGDWVTKLREAVVNGRYKRMAPTIFTSNNSPADSADLFSPRMVDRFEEMFNGSRRVFAITDTSWRSR